MKLTQLYDLPVSGRNGQSGYVLGAIAVGGNIEYLACCDWEEREFFIRVDRILSLGEAIVYDAAEKKAPSKNILRLGIPCCDEHGKYLGTTCDVRLTGWRIKSVQVGARSYAYPRLVWGDVIIVKDKTSGISPDIAAKDLFIGAVCAD